MTRTPSYTSHDGFLMPMGFPADAFGSALGYRPRAGDVFVTSYPKCGTTWMQNIIWLLANGGKPLEPHRRLTDVFPHLEEVGAEAADRLAEPRLIKTHLPFDMAPFDSAARYVYVARNPFDCAVSFYHHTRGFVKHYDFADGTFDDFFDCFLRGAVDFGDYFDNLLSWGEPRDRKNIFFTTYEDLRRDPGGVVGDVARFLGSPFAETAGNAEDLERVLEHSSFSSMKRDQQRWSSRRPPGAPAFIRKGTVGDWESHFSREQAARLAEKFDRRTEGTWMAGLWPDVLERARG